MHGTYIVIEVKRPQNISRNQHISSFLLYPIFILKNRFGNFKGSEAQLVRYEPLFMHGTYIVLEVKRPQNMSRNQHISSFLLYLIFII